MQAKQDDVFVPASLSVCLCLCNCQYKNRKTKPADQKSMQLGRHMCYDEP